MSFAEEAWGSVTTRYAAILDHPFVAGLVDGSLDHEVFVRYLADDATYLVSYARTLAAVAARMPTAAGIAELAGAAVGAVTAERELHSGFLAPLGLDPDAPGAPAPTPTCRAYTGFLAEQAACAPVEVALAAVLPCFRVYAEVGRTIAGRVPADRAATHPYAAWIATYADPAFDAAVRRVEAHTDALAGGSAHWDAMLAAYGVSTDFEWRFWQAAWTDER